MKKLQKYFPYILFFIYLALLLWSGISPVDRGVWVAEEGTVLLVVGILLFSFKKFRFSNISYFLMFLWIVIHTIGGKYTFEYVPFDWFNDLFGFERNMFDRVGHFIIGFYAFPIMEIISRKKLIENKLILSLFGLFSIISIAGLYEVFEWLYAIYLDPATGGAVLGSQGDIWDAQKDILMDTSGAIFAIFLYWSLHQSYKNYKKPLS